jgi:hypothetical protein
MAEPQAKCLYNPKSPLRDFHSNGSHSSASVEKWIASLMTLPAVS